jgi:hypothetical protein
MPSLLLRAVRQAEAGVANGINAIMRLVGGAIGAQLSAGILSTQVIPASGLPTEAAFTLAFAISAVGIGLAGVVGLTIPSRAELARTASF